MAENLLVVTYSVIGIAYLVAAVAIYLAGR